jgi:hypothetical protein
VGGKRISPQVHRNLSPREQVSQLLWKAFRAQAARESCEDGCVTYTSRFELDAKPSPQGLRAIRYPRPPESDRSLLPTAWMCFLPCTSAKLGPDAVQELVDDAIVWASQHGLVRT